MTQEQQDRFEWMIATMTILPRWHTITSVEPEFLERYTIRWGRNQSGLAHDLVAMHKGEWLERMGRRNGVWLYRLPEDDV